MHPFFWLKVPYIFSTKDPETSGRFLEQLFSTLKSWVSPRCRGLLKHFDQMTGRGLITSPEIEVTSSWKLKPPHPETNGSSKKTHLKNGWLEYDFVSFLGASKMPIFQGANLPLKFRKCKCMKKFVVVCRLFVVPIVTKEFRKGYLKWRVYILNLIFGCFGGWGISLP